MFLIQPSLIQERKKLSLIQPSLIQKKDLSFRSKKEPAIVAPIFDSGVKQRCFFDLTIIDSRINRTVIDKATFDSGAELRTVIDSTLVIQEES